SLEGKGGEFYTPKSVVKLLVEMIEPFKGKVYDPCCGSGGMFVQSESFVEAHGGNDEDILIYGQESNPATWRLCKMNLAIRGIKGDIGLIHGDTFRNDLHQGLEADFILANPPFNMTDWGGDKLRGDRRWVYGVPPSNNANYAWLQHIVSHLAPDGMAGLVLSNGSLSTNQDRDEGHIRRAMVEADVVDCIVALPPNMFYTTQIPACLWFLAKNKSDSRYRDRCGETLFIYAHNFGRMVDRTHRELTDDEVSLIAKTYNTWRSQNSFSLYKDIPGFCKSATLAEVKEHKYALVPGRYVGFDNTSTEQWDISRLRSEIAQVESRFVQINKTSQAALSLLQELLDGESFLKQP
ncbi:MAG: N-6 DNA methylase, partial [Chloroflexota bacterium]